MTYFDRTCFRVHQMMFWPSVPKDAPYDLIVHDGAPLDVDAWLQTYDDWHDMSQWPLAGREEQIMRAGATIEGPTTKPGLSGAFCRAYSIQDAIAAFIPNVYLPVEGNPVRYTYAYGSGLTGGAIVYDNGTVLYSNHDTDPVEKTGYCVKACDMVSMHLFGAKDASTKPMTPANLMPSFLAMQELALKDKPTLRALDEEREAQVQ